MAAVDRKKMTVCAQQKEEKTESIGPRREKVLTSTEQCGEQAVNNKLVG